MSSFNSLMRPTIDMPMLCWGANPDQALRSMRLRSRTQDLPNWNYDGSSCGQAPGTDSEVYLIPRAIFKDPFRGGDHILVMCDCHEPPRVQPDNSVIPMKPIPGNTRVACAEAMEKVKEEVPWFGIEQVRASWPRGSRRTGHKGGIYGACVCGGGSERGP
eukprot:354903-Chlamydomonas_euryale.AAC.20